MCDGSVTKLVRELEAGSTEAAQRLWDRYSARLLELARRKLSGGARVFDEEDVAITVFESICRAAVEGRFANVRNRDELWWLLVAATKRKVADQARYERRKKRGGGRVVGESDAGRAASPFRLDELIGDDPTPEFLVMLDEEHRRLLRLLPDEQSRMIAIRRIQGFTCKEVALEVGVSARTVYRRLKRIGERWEHELERELGRSATIVQTGEARAVTDGYPQARPPDAPSVRVNETP